MLIKAEETLGGVEEARAIIERVHNPVSFSPCLSYIIFSHYPNYLVKISSLLLSRINPHKLNMQSCCTCKCVLLNSKFSYCQDDCRAYCLCRAQIENTASTIATKVIFI